MTEDDQSQNNEQSNYLEQQRQEYRWNIEANLDDYLTATADDVAVPRSAVISLSADLQLSKALKIIIKHRFSYYPVYNSNNIDDIVGLMSLKDLLINISDIDTKKVSDIMRPVHYMSYSEPAWQVLQKMQKHHIKSAIVVNEYGEADGFICAEDIIEELVGDIADEYDLPAPPLIKQADNKMTISGQYDLDELSEKFSLQLSNVEPVTLSGYISHSLGRIPNIGEEMTIDNLKFKILDSDSKKISLVELEILK